MQMTSLQLNATRPTRGLPPYLHAIAEGEDVACHLAGFLEEVRLRMEAHETAHIFGEPKVALTPDARDALFVMLVRTEAALYAHLPPEIAPDIHAGMQAAAAQIEMWAETPELSKDRAFGAIQDIQDRARILENTAGILAAREAIAKRAGKITATAETMADAP